MKRRKAAVTLAGAMLTVVTWATDAQAQPPPRPVSGYQVVTSTQVQPGSSLSDYQLPCPGTKHVLGGGYDTEGATAANSVDARTSSPTANGTAWRVRIDNSNVGPITVQLFAVCANTAP
ncbi:hypothetical protein [Streptomyces sp. NPDC046727]|uniref:hypothetical protein n=1 Tax=Streptomyces sp. NPDC046727 TaxID=3155373 RepID=UPI0033CB22D0